MPFEFKLAWRYFRGRRRSLARFTAVVAVVGIAAGVAALIVAQALGRGFADEMRERILAGTAHVAVFRRDGAPLGDWRALAAVLTTADGVARVRPEAHEHALLVGAGGTSYALIRAGGAGGDGLTGAEIRVGARLAEKLDLAAGATAELATAAAPTLERARVGGVFETGLFDYDSTWVYVSPENFARLNGQPEFAPSTLTITVRDIYASAATARALRARFGAEYTVIDWQEANRPLFAALSLERRAALAVIGLIIFIAALNITTTLALLVGERRLDIAVLRTCGARTRQLAALFLIEGALLGAVGVAAGVAVGLAGCFLGNYWRVVSLPAEVYELTYVPLRPTPESVAAVALGAFGLCLAASLYPALRAARLRPLENLRRP